MPTKKLILTLAVVLLLSVIGIKLAKFINQAPVPKINQVQAQTGFVPDPDSPLGKGEHPRLHITQNTLPYFRDKIANYYSEEYQEFVDWLDANFDSDVDENVGLMADYHALLHLLGTIEGINYARNLSEYGERAIDIMINRVNEGVPAAEGKAHYFRGGIEDEIYDGREVIARTYDWMWNELTVEQKASIADWLAEAGVLILNGVTKGIKHGDIYELWSSNYFESFYPWYYGLAFYGDGIRDEDAQTLVDSFETLNLNGKWLDAQNWIARSHGGVSEIGYYSLFHPLRHIIQIDAWRIATGENYFSQGTSVSDACFIQYHPQYLTYRISPFGKTDSYQPGGIKWKTIKVGQENADAYIGFYQHRQVIAALGEPLKSTNTDMAGLNRWLILNRVGDEMYPPDNFIHFLWGDRSTSPNSPEVLGLPLSQYFEGLGMAIMRTGFDSLDDTAILVLAPNYQLGGHDWGPWTLIPAGFTVDKYGPLLIKKMAYLRGATTLRKNIMRFTDPLATPDSGFGSSVPDAPTDVRNYTQGSSWDIGGMKRRIFENDYDYLYMDYTKYYGASGRVVNYTRQFIYLKPQTRNDSDYIVVLDRTETTRPDILKRWELNMAYNPQINGEESQVREGKWEYTNADQIIISNNVSPDPYSGEDYGGHGRLFVKTLLPQEFKIVKVGGPDHEFEYDDGTAHGYKNEESDYSYLNKAGAFYTGTYHTDVVALGENIQENFLHVLQTADANLVSEMAPVSRIDGDKMVGAYIQDDIQGHKVAMFSRTEENQSQVFYSIESSQTIKQLITDLWPSASYEVYQDGKQIDTASASESGTIYFTSSGGGDFQITGIGINIPPTVEVSADATSGTVPLTVQFTATAQDPDGTIASYSWDFGDEGTSTEQNPSHTYTTAGTYIATLTVTDNGGAEASDTITITVEAPPPDSTPPTIPQGLSSIGQYETFISLTWQAASDPETGVDFYKIYRDETQIDTTEQTSYTDTGLTVNTTYSYQVSAVNGIGLESEKSDPLNVTTQTDTIPPTVVSVTTESTTQVKIVFSETIEQISAEEPSNYNIDQGITIFSVSLDSNQATLTISDLNEQAIYTLTINNVTDQASQPNTIAPETTFTFRGTNFIAHWAFDEGTGQTAQDSSPGQNNPGTIYGAIWTTGKINTALEFDGIDDYVEVPSSDELKLANRGTITAWIKPKTFPSDTVTTIIYKGVSRWDSDYALSFWKGAYADKIYVLLYGDSSEQQWRANYTFSTDIWYHIAATWDGNIIKFYVNGVEEDNTSQTVIPKRNGGTVTIGSHYDTNYFDGLIDGVHIYDGALNPEEILSLYQQELDTTSPSPITDLAAATGTNAGEVDLTWTAPGDDGDIGTANAYIIKYSTTEVTEIDWDSAAEIPNSLMPQVSGRTEIFTVSGLTPGETYYFAIKTEDEVPNTADISNSPNAAAKAVPNITIIKTADKTEAALGDIITYTIAIQNIGTAPGYNIVITDVIPEKTIYVSGAERLENNTAFWNIKKLKPGESKKIELKLKVEGG